MGQLLCKGLELKQNKDLIPVLRLHYTADPSKDPETKEGKTWLEMASKMYIGGRTSLQWRREMEIDYNAGAGELVFPEFPNIEQSILVDPFIPDDTFSLFGGFDWGTRNPVSFHVYAESQDGTFYSIWEWYETQKSVSAVAEAVKKLCPFYERLQWIAADPTIWNENQSTKTGFTSIARLFNEDLPEDLKLDKLMSAHGRSDMLFISKLKNIWSKENPKFKIVKTCFKQIQEFRNLKYPQRIETINEAEKILDKDNHAVDDCKYFMLSHPSICSVEIKEKPGTFGELWQKQKQAEQMSENDDVSFEDAFRSL